jgi:frataxin-like iron-binding protein CyaY
VLESNQLKLYCEGDRGIRGIISDFIRNIPLQQLWVAVKVGKTHFDSEVITSPSSHVAG